MEEKSFKPFISADQVLPEITPVSIGLGIILAVLFGAANAYLGLRVGMTVSASIPAAVLSMGIIRIILKRDSILENNMVQTIGSAGESLAAGAIFTLPALFMWANESDAITKPSFWVIAIISLCAALLGLIFMVPLRSALIVEEHGTLPFPEGTACAEVLLAGEEGGENGSAKGSFVREGFFRDVDAALCVHPGSDHHELTHEEIACAPIRIAFKGKASHASSAPHEGINALDAMILVFNAIGLLRQQLPQDVRIHGIITKGGDAPNIIPDDTEAKFYVRAATVKRMMDVYHKLERIVEGAAAQTGCTGLLEPTQRNLVENIVPTPSFDAVYQRVLESLGETFEEDKRQPLGSSDVGNVSQVIPVIQPMIRISDVPVAGHSIEKREACRSESGLRSIALGAKALALTALELIEKPEELEQIKADHAEAVQAQQ